MQKVYRVTEPTCHMGVQCTKKDEKNEGNLWFKSSQMSQKRRSYPRNLLRYSLVYKQMVAAPTVPMPSTLPSFPIHPLEFDEWIPD